MDSESNSSTIISDNNPIEETNNDDAISIVSDESYQHQIPIKDVVFISQYAVRILDTIPETATEIKLSGDVLYSYLSVHPSIKNPNTPILSYKDYVVYSNKLITIIDMPAEDLTEEEQIQQRSAIQFNEFCNNFPQTYFMCFSHYNPCKKLVINLSRFQQLEKVYFYRIFCRTIMKIPNTVRYLSCRSCNLMVLGKAPKSLTILNCNDNCLTYLPCLHNTQLQSLFCNRNDIKKLPKLPDSTEWIYCYNNKLKYLPDILPKSLTILSCTNNRIEYLPELPNKMAKLFIENNYIQSIPQTLPKTLTDFFIANNGIVKLPELPPFLKRISCHRNRIKEYEPFPPSIIYANLDGTPMQLDTKNSYILLGAMMNGL